MFKDYFAALRLGGNFEEISDIFDRRGVSTELQTKNLILYNKAYLNL